MKRTSTVATTSVHSPSSRGRVDHATVRAHFESWLTEIAHDIDKERGDRLQELFDRSPLTQRKLADAIGVDARTVQRWLRGGGIAPENREPLASALGASVGYVMHGQVERPDPHDILGRLDAIEEALRSRAGGEGPTTYADLADMAKQQRALAAAVAELTEIVRRGMSPNEGAGGEGDRRRPA
ncbi:MAG TPA: helix-turn-helix transcriptional regulator [Gaiellales bacterium]|nr:helix-turn-helix transcriptional regulator [Gaiellales bacterium]